MNRLTHAPGLTEIAGQDNDGQPNLQGLTLQDKLARPVY